MYKHESNEWTEVDRKRTKNIDLANILVIKGKIGRTNYYYSLGFWYRFITKFVVKIGNQAIYLTSSIGLQIKCNIGKIALDTRQCFCCCFNSIKTPKTVVFIAHPIVMTIAIKFDGLKIRDESIELNLRFINKRHTNVHNISLHWQMCVWKGKTAGRLVKTCTHFTNFMNCIKLCSLQRSTFCPIRCVLLLYFTSFPLL